MSNFTLNAARIHWERFGGITAGILLWVAIALLFKVFGWWTVGAGVVLFVYLFWHEVKAQTRQNY